MNVELFPGSANVYDSLAEALTAAGDRVGAIRNYQKVLAIAPANANALAKLRELQASEPPKTP
jgi:predicted TPR repeat methyltransferase